MGGTAQPLWTARCATCSQFGAVEISERVRAVFREAAKSCAPPPDIGVTQGPSSTAFWPIAAAWLARTG
jgi:hypothetical protein